MTSLKLRKKSFPIIAAKFDHIDEYGVPCYRLVLKFVVGDVFDFLDHKWGIYRTEHTANKKRKNDYVMVDLSTGRTVRIDSRRVYILEDLETAWLRQELLDIINGPEYKKNVKEFEHLKKGKR